MELKSHSASGDLLSVLRSNRTFMELKSAKSLTDIPVPFCSNRTFMELKLQQAAVQGAQQKVLIVPLWN